MSDTLTRLLVELTPLLLEIIGGLLAALISWAAMTARRKWGLDIEARHRDALHSALMTGARLALSRGLFGDAAATLAQDYAKTSVPDAMRHLHPAAEVLQSLARAKIAEVDG